MPIPAPSGGGYGTNASPVAELGTLLASDAVGTGAMTAVYDPQNGYVYDLSYGSTNGIVSVLNGTATVANITVGVGPYGMAFEPHHGYLYVGNYNNGNGNTVSVINGTQVIATLTVGGGPFWQVVDPVRGWDYSIGYLGTITVLNGTKSLATLTESSGLFGGIYDPSNGYIYVTQNTLGEVLVFNGTKLVATVATGGSPTLAAVDSVNGWVYVEDSLNAAVLVLNGTKLVKSVDVGGTPTAVVYDAETGWVYVGTSNSPATIAVVNGTTVHATVTLKGSSYLSSMGYDPANGYVYVPYGTAIVALNATSIAGSIPVSMDFGFASNQMVVSPTTGDLYVPNYAYSVVLVVSTVLATGTPTALPIGNPAGSMDVGQTVGFRTVLWGIGTGSDVPTAEVAPGSGLGCPASPSLAEFGDAPALALSCTPTTAGNYSVWLNTSDGSASVWSRIPIQVFPAPVARTPVASVGALASVTHIDIGQLANFTETATGGTGNYTAYSWSGLNSTSCLPPGGSHFSCTFRVAGTYSLSVRVNDSNGGFTAPSPTLHLLVSARPSVAAPVANRTSADVGQPVTFRAVASGGTGTYPQYQWSGLESGTCTGLAGGSPSCVFSQATNLTVTAAATDSAEVTTSPSPATSFTVYADPTTSTPQATRSALDVAQSVNFTTNTTGGSGSLTYRWSGLPGGCAQTQTDSPRCIPDQAGHFVVMVQALDSNGVWSAPTPPIQLVVSDDPVVAGPTLSASSVALRDAVRITADVSGGASPYTYAWVNLPAGCESTSALVNCQPTASGTFHISVTVTDSNGFQSLSKVSTLQVSNPPSPAPTIAGLSPTLFAGIVGGVAAVAVVAGLLVWLRRRR